ncbi:MAG: DEAD/DEAH box helicase [Treponema sp.]|nr:DEAD/DEAH box helicase [Treponema sp.]
MLPQTFHPLIRSWFTAEYGNPTPVQAEAWPLIERGEHVLALAPTGSGKTLTAFLSAISRFCSNGEYQADKLSVLYISPLKALNEDIKRNLLEPLAAIKACFEKEGLPFPPVRVETRSGDTPQSQRRRFLIHPPSILALTPESLSILLLNPKGRQTLSNVKYLIIDEVHAMIGNKRGAFLSCQIDRLAHIAGEFQRISLSATVRSPQITADFIGSIAGKHSARKVNIVSPPAEKKIDFRIEYPDMDDSKPGSRYTPLIEYVIRRIWEGATLLVFADSRRRAERLCYFINTEAAAVFAKSAGQNLNSGRLSAGAVAYPHHGSLSKELRRSVEKGLAEGRLPCVVATASLELGIDIGDIDEVVLAGSPVNVSQVLQRIGRSGHSVGQTSRGRLFAFHGKDLLLAAALKSAVDERDIEEVRPIENPLDILAQLTLALCAEKNRNIDELYDHIKNFYIFRNLNYDSYYRVVLMLAGLASKENPTRLRDVKPRIWFDKIEGTIGILDGTTTLLYSSGGVIANRGLYSLRLADGTKIGELDEEFVWERAIGDCFDFGARGWRIASISSESVEVIPMDKRADYIPFWKGEALYRSINLTQRLLSLLDEYNRTSDVPDCLSQEARNSLKEFLDLQHFAQNKLPLPDSKNIILEIIKGNELNRDFCSVVFHSFRGGQVNFPLSLALSMELEEYVKLRVACFSSDDNILFLIPRPGLEEAGAVSMEDLFRASLLNLERAEKGGLIRAERLFRNRLESSGVFGANFREAAERSLLLPKAPFGKRTPLWIMRQRAKRLFDAVAEEDGFPVTAESWRSCLVDTFDMNGFRELISSINSGGINLSFFHTNNPSPFSRDIVRQETNAFMYEYDERSDLAASKSATLSDRAIEDAISNASLRPVLKTAAVDSFVSRLRREIQGYAPDDALSLNEWVKERIAIPADEWETLCALMPKEIIENIDKNKIKTVMRKGACIASVIHREWEEIWINEPLNALGQWLRYEGPVSMERICAVFGTSSAETEDALDALVEVEEALRDVEVENNLYVCDRENLEMLLRLSRKKERPVIKERPASLIVPFIALRQGFGNDTAAFRKSLYAWTAPVKIWESEILCARNQSYTPENINREIKDGQLIWYGAGKERIGFCRPEDLDLIFETQKEENHFGAIKKDSPSDTQNKMAQLASSTFFYRPRDFWEIKEEFKSDSRSCAEALWNEVWHGKLTADSLEPVRRGIEYGFVPKEIEIPQAAGDHRPLGRHGRIPSALKNRWKSGAPVHGNWFSILMDGQDAADPIEEDAIKRDRVRLLLDRFGILCRPLLANEDSVFSWSKLLPVMRRLELAGELVTGRFFAGINSLQFAPVSIAAELEQAENYKDIYWMNASDPASPAGLEIEGLSYRLCARSVNNRLYYRDASLIAISAKNGKELEIFIKADDPDIAKLITLFKVPRTRAVQQEKKIIVEKINRKEASQSSYADVFKEQGFESDRGKLILW